MCPDDQDLDRHYTGEAGDDGVIVGRSAVAAESVNSVKSRVT
jgi:hypothetical protein